MEEKKRERWQETERGRREKERERGNMKIWETFKIVTYVFLFVFYSIILLVDFGVAEKVLLVSGISKFKKMFSHVKV